MRPAGATNFKWSIADVDRIARCCLSGMSPEQIFMELQGTELESTLEEIEGLCAQTRRTSSWYPAFARTT